MFRAPLNLLFLPYLTSGSWFLLRRPGFTSSSSPLLQSLSSHDIGSHFIPPSSEPTPLTPFTPFTPLTPLAPLAPLAPLVGVACQGQGSMGQMNQLKAPSGEREPSFSATAAAGLGVGGPSGAGASSPSGASGQVPAASTRSGAMPLQSAAHGSKDGSKVTWDSWNSDS